jgi:hypothetical protein
VQMRAISQGDRSTAVTHGQVAAQVSDCIGRDRHALQAGGRNTGERLAAAYRVISVRPSCSAKSSKSLTLSVASGRP